MDGQKILVVITSALFAGSNGRKLNEVSPNRIMRLRQSIVHLSEGGFGHFILLDNTLPADFDVKTVLPDLGINLTVPSLTEVPVLFETDEYQKNGPSRLEAVLLYQAIPRLSIEIQDFEFILKISAGYQVKNLKRILDQANNGVVYRMGSPFRKVIKFCLTSFYVLPLGSFIDLCTYFYAHLDNISSSKPLEYHFYRYITAKHYQPIVIDYPLLNADFLSSGRSSSDLDYRLKETVFKLLSRLGMYAYQPK